MKIIITDYTYHGKYYDHTEIHLPNNGTDFSTFLTRNSSRIGEYIEKAVMAREEDPDKHAFALDGLVGGNVRKEY